MNTPALMDYVQISVIVACGTGSKVLQTAKHFGISGGTVLLGTGTVSNRLLNILGLADTKKEIVLMVTDVETADRTLGKLDEIFKFDKPNHGIAFTTAVCLVVGTSTCRLSQFQESRGNLEHMYHAITVIVDKGRAEDVIEAATRAGSTGGTIINARGSGIHETSRLFSMDIEPEKEIVMILSNRSRTDAIVESIRSDLKLDEPGKGILFIQSVEKTYGLFE